MSQRFLMIDRKLMLITVCPYSGELPRNTVRYFYYLLDAKRDKYVSTALRHQRKLAVLTVASLANKTWFVKIVEELTNKKAKRNA